MVPWHIFWYHGTFFGAMGHILHVFGAMAQMLQELFKLFQRWTPSSNVLLVKWMGNGVSFPPVHPFLPSNVVMGALFIMSNSYHGAGKSDKSYSHINFKLRLSKKQIIWHQGSEWIPRKYWKSLPKETKFLLLQNSPACKSW